MFDNYLSAYECTSSLFTSATGERMYFGDIRVNDVDAAPCECGRDLGPYSGTGVTPQLVDGSEEILTPIGLVGFAVYAPETRFVWCIDESGKVVSRVKVQAGDLHVMYSPFGGSMQFSVNGGLFETSDPNTAGSFGRADYSGEVHRDPRWLLLRNFWSQNVNPFDVVPFPVVRTGPVKTLGQLALVSIGTRWFDMDGTVHTRLGSCYIVPEGDQTRFLRPHELRREFAGVR